MTDQPKRRTRAPLALGVAIALISALGALWVSGRPQPTQASDTVAQPSASSSASAAPSGSASASTASTPAPPAAATTLTPGDPAAVLIYIDPQCPICAQFEQAFGAELKALVAAQKITVDYHLMSFLDGNLKNDSSTRGANAMLCAKDAGKFPEYVEAVLLGQPAHEGDGFTDARLVELAGSVGIAGPARSTFETCVKDKTHLAQVIESERAAEAAGVQGTPSVAVDGVVMDLGQLTLDNLEELIAGMHG
jgi:protein-disulfide isomerase